MFKKERTKQESLVILIIGFAVMFVLIIGIKINYKNNPPQDVPQIKYITLKEAFNRLNNQHYEYNYVVTQGTDKIYYTGYIENNINSGTKFHNDELIHYIIDGVSTKNKDTNEIIDIYEGIIHEFFNSNFLTNLISQLECSTRIDNKLKVYSCDTKYNELDTNINVYLAENNINKIEINYNQQSYLLQYNNIIY